MPLTVRIRRPKRLALYIESYTTFLYTAVPPLVNVISLVEDLFEFAYCAYRELA